MQVQVQVQEWEYHVEYLDMSVQAESIAGGLDKWGGEGWELVSVAPLDYKNVASDAGSGLVAVFKRPKASKPGEPFAMRG